MNTTQQKIESLLFYKNEPVSYNWLAKTLNTTIPEIKKHISGMMPHYEQRGVTLVAADTSVSLMTATVAADMIARLTKKEDARELSKQALETLSIIIYKGLATKAEIDFIRGVNSIFILRNLLIRGLIEKKPNPEDKRSPMYTVTHDTLSFLGIPSAEALPKYAEYTKKLADLEEQYQQEKEDLTTDEE